jgi:hypothetical protein
MQRAFRRDTAEAEVEAQSEQNPNCLNKTAAVHATVSAEIVVDLVVSLPSVETLSRRPSHGRRGVMRGDPF